MERSLEETNEAFRILWALHLQTRGALVMAMEAIAAQGLVSMTEKGVQNLMSAGYSSGFVAGMAWANVDAVPYEQKFMADQAEDVLAKNREQIAKHNVDLDEITLPTSWAPLSDLQDKIEAANKEASETCPCPKCRADRGEPVTDGPLPDLHLQEKMQRVQEDVEKAMKEVCERHGLNLGTIDLTTPQG